jgi:hypothetical protein
MSYYTILNFEDDFAANATGKVKGGTKLDKLGARGAAAGTAQI